MATPCHKPMRKDDNNCIVYHYGLKHVIFMSCQGMNLFLFVSIFSQQGILAAMSWTSWLTVLVKLFFCLDEFHDQGDSKWIVMRGQLRGHNHMPFGQPTPSRPIGRPEVGRLSGVFGGFSYYQLIVFFFNIVPLIMEFSLRFPSFHSTVLTAGTEVSRLFSFCSASRPRLQASGVVPRQHRRTAWGVQRGRRRP
jgi:hypothetical protein